MDWKTHKKQLLKDPEFKAALKEVELEYNIARMVIPLRTQQSVISRVENAKTTPSLSFLKRLSKALDSKLQVQFVT